MKEKINRKCRAGVPLNMNYIQLEGNCAFILGFHFILWARTLTKSILSLSKVSFSKVNCFKS
jgi:hypothetical protein